MNSGPLVSVVITCYNIRDYVKDAIRSVLNQTYHNYEIIVVDDGSTDGTDEELRSTCSTSTVTYLRKENGGPSSARNLGISSAKGEMIAFLDGDDIWEAEKLERQVAALIANPEAGMIFSDFSTFDEEGLVASRKNRSMFVNLEPVTYEYILSRNNFIYPSTVIVRRTILELCGNFDESLRGPEDWDLWLRIAYDFVVIGIHAPLVRIRQHSTNISTNVASMLENERRAIEKQRSKLGCLAYRQRLARLYLLNADRSIHNGSRRQAVGLTCKALVNFPFHVIPSFIVLIKFVLGGKAVESLRRKINDNSYARQCFEQVYKRY